MIFLSLIPWSKFNMGTFEKQYNMIMLMAPIVCFDSNVHLF
jgi:hypothetical protein